MLFPLSFSAPAPNALCQTTFSARAVLNPCISSVQRVSTQSILRQPTHTVLPFNMPSSFAPRQTIYAETHVSSAQRASAACSAPLRRSRETSRSTMPSTIDRPPSMSLSGFAASDLCRIAFTSRAASGSTMERTPSALNLRRVPFARSFRSARFRRLLRAAAQEQGDEQEYNAEHSRQAAVAQRLRAERFMQDCAHEQGCERQYDGANAERAPSV